MPPKKNNFFDGWKFPHEMSKKEFNEDYIQVTEHNRKDMIKLGRVYYSIDTTGRKPVKNGIFCVYPCLRPKATLVVKNDFSSPANNYEVWCGEGQDYEEWKNNYNLTITRLINLKQCFVNKKLKLAEFSWK